ncbi:MAG: AAA family ATPase [Boseongicola sp.]|nr:AAA family ATPase [Boseongicola sp.]
MSDGAARIESEDEETVVRIELTHRGAAGDGVNLDLNLESAGTRRHLVLPSQAFSALDRGMPIIVDELDASLHTHSSEAVVRLFCSPMANRKGAQLIATTHDTNLMRSSALRRDQLWFAEKDAEGSTEIYPLTDIRTRKGDNLELGYLQGRHGAVPLADPVATMLESA